MQNTFIALVAAGLISGCSSTRNFETRISTLEKENLKLRTDLDDARGSQLAIQQAALAAQKKNECILRHNDAKHSCDLLFRGEQNSILLQNKLLQCLSNKGFPNGLAACR